MKDRMTMGFCADAAETAELTVPDERATERIVEAMDWEHDRMADGAAIAAALRRLDADGRAFAQSVLCGRSWDDMGMSRSTFYWRLKKT